LRLPGGSEQAGVVETRPQVPRRRFAVLGDGAVAFIGSICAWYAGSLRRVASIT
jgi:hypothetical protein